MPVTAFTVTFPVKFGVGRGGLAWTLAQNYARSEEPLGMLRYIVHTQTPYVESYSRDTYLSSPKKFEVCPEGRNYAASSEGW